MPNVVILMSDEHNPFYTSVYGHRRVQTPNMERLAQMGTVFENAYCNSPLCLPSRSSFMAGKPAHQLQFYNNSNVFQKNYPSYADALTPQGVHVVHIGKTDVWNEPETLGFSEMIQPDARKVPGDRTFTRRPFVLREGGEKRANRYGVKEDPYTHDELRIDEAVKWLEQTAPQLNDPWSLCVNIVSPHFPHYVTQELWDMYPDGGDLPAYGMDTETATHPYASDLRQHFMTEKFTEEQIRGLRRGYLGCVTYVDRQIGRLLDTLERTRMLEDTVFIYTSDHGEMLGQFGMWWKSSLLEDSARIPIIATGPGFGKGTRVRTPVSLLDVQASIFRALGKIRPRDWWGEPLQDISVDDHERAVFSEYHGHGTRSGAFMIRRGAWKLIYNMEAPHQLHHLETDPHELNNRAEEEPAVLEELIAILRSYCVPEIENERAHRYEAMQSEAVSRL